MTAIAEPTFAPTMGAELANANEANRFGARLDQLLHQLQDSQTQNRAGNAPTLDAPNRDHSAENLSLLLLDLRDQLTQIQLKQSKEDIHHNLDKKQSATEKRLDAIHKAIEAMKKAKKGGLFGKVFGWVSAAVMLAAAVAVTVVSGGAGAPLLAAAIFNVTVMALEESGHMQELQKKLADAMGSDIGAALLITGVILAVNIAAGGAANAAIKSAQLSTKAIQTAQRIMVAGEAAGGIAMVGKGSSQMVAASYEKEAAEASAESMDMARLMKKLQAMIEDEADRLEEVIRQMDDMTVMVMNIVKSANEATSRIKIGT